MSALSLTRWRRPQRLAGYHIPPRIPEHASARAAGSAVNIAAVISAGGVGTDPIYAAIEAQTGRLRWLERGSLHNRGLAELIPRRRRSVRLL